MIKKILAGLIILITIIQICSPCAFALEMEGSKRIVSTGRTVQGHILYLKDGETREVMTTVVGYYDNGKFYPAYCLNYRVNGVEHGEYDVDISSYMDNPAVWRIITHGFPYTTNFNGIELEPDDAYFVTKIAIYCVTGNSHFEIFTKDPKKPITVKTYDALNYLVNTVAVDESINKQEGTITIERSGEFIENGDYYSQDFSVKSILEEKSYEVKNISGFPEGTIVANLNNSPQRNFNAEENFRILIPKNKITEDISGTFEINGKVKNYPIFYGDAKDPTKQSYVVTFDEFGDEVARGNFSVSTNTGKVKVLKVDSETKVPLEGFEFELKRNNTNEVFKGTTNENGEIIFENLFPGQYTLVETKAREDYKINNNSFSIDVKYNEQSEITVEDDIIKGYLRIIKQDFENSNIRLKGVQFELYDENMNLLETLETDEKGEAVSGLYPSVNKKYYLKEIKTVEGYSFSKELIEVTLKGDTFFDLFIKNTKIPKETETVVIEEKPEPKVVVETLEPDVITVYEKPDPVIEYIMEEPEIIQEVIKLPKTGM